MSSQWPNEQRGVDSLVAVLAIAGQSNGLMVCPIALWPSNSASDSWMAIYQQAYEQVRRAFSPSPYQRALEPSLN
jgi:hypothetical protein